MVEYAELLYLMERFKGPKHDKKITYSHLYFDFALDVIRFLGSRICRQLGRSHLGHGICHNRRKSHRYNIDLGKSRNIGNEPEALV